MGRVLCGSGLLRREHFYGDFGIQIYVDSDFRVNLEVRQNTNPNDE